MIVGDQRAPIPAPLLDRREVLTLRQVAQLLGVSPDDAATLLTRESTPRVVGWGRAAVEALRVRVERGEIEEVRPA